MLIILFSHILISYPVATEILSCIFLWHAHSEQYFVSFSCTPLCFCVSVLCRKCLCFRWKEVHFQLQLQPKGLSHLLPVAVEWQKWESPKGTNFRTLILGANSGLPRTALSNASRTTVPFWDWEGVGIGAAISALDQLSDSFYTRGYLY